MGELLKNRLRQETRGEEVQGVESAKQGSGSGLGQPDPLGPAHRLQLHRLEPRQARTRGPQPGHRNGDRRCHPGGSQHRIRSDRAGHDRNQVLNDGTTDPWTSAFETALGDRDKDASDLIPYWISTDGLPEDARIERHLPFVPLSRDEIRLDRLKKSRAVYRMVFGQPRQDDLVEHLIWHVP